jgi:sorting nexin-1/2
VRTQLAFASRVKAYGAWQYADSESRRIKSAHEKARKQGRIPTDRLSASLNEIGEVRDLVVQPFNSAADAIPSQFERRAHDAKREFDNVSRLVKSEVARFEHERIEDFKASMSTFLKGMIEKQKLVGLLSPIFGHLHSRLDLRR